MSLLFFDKSKTKADQQSHNTETRHDNGELLAYLRDIVFLIAGIFLIWLARIFGFLGALSPL